MILKASGLPGSFDETQVSDPAVVRLGEAYWLYYHGRDDGPYRRIGRALSPDGENFLRVSGDAEKGSTFGRGPHGFDDGGGMEPFLWLEGGELRLAYTSLHF